MKPPRYLCPDCDHGEPRWFGRCPACGSWTGALEDRARPAATPVPIASVVDGPARFPTGIPEVDRVLGGGLVVGEVALLAGEPGIGKSTLLLQLMQGLCESGRSSLLVSGEESMRQVALRATRLGLSAEGLKGISTTSVDTIVETARAEHPDVLLVDSVQALRSPSQDAGAGTVTQVRDCAAALAAAARRDGTVVVLAGHVTKEGAVAGPKVLEHLVDAVLLLEGERSGGLRLLRATKNRYGSCDETGVFVMGGRGLEPVGDASAMFLADRREGTPGSVVFPALEGSRAVLVEVQALVGHGRPPQPRRVAIGVDARRLALLLGVLSRRTRLRADRHDVFVSAAGGMTVREPAADVALCASLFSAMSGMSVHDRLIALGEVGLGGEVRRVPGMERRLTEARRLGFERAIVPASVEGRPAGIELHPVRHLDDVMAVLRTFRRVESIVS